MTIKILFVGQTWRGSSARSMREALEALPGVVMDDIAEDHYFPKHRAKALRGINRLLRPWQTGELSREIITKLKAFQPEVVIVFKGSGVRADFVRRIKSFGALTVNLFPDCSPHAFGTELRNAMGEYDLVISTKPFHPAGWHSIYGYDNQCVCVPHGYDPSVHYWTEPETHQDLDVVLAATWRPQYHSVILTLADQLKHEATRVGLAGYGWADRRNEFPATWEFAGPIHGRGYGEWLRRGKIVIAPVHRDMTIDGVQQPGDVDTRRTYELASAHCFFLHRRTEYAQTIYDEQTEVPMWDSADELRDLILHFLPREAERRAMAAAAHTRAVPAYSIPTRAAQVLQHILDLMDR